MTLHLIYTTTTATTCGHSQLTYKGLLAFVLDTWGQIMENFGAGARPAHFRPSKTSRATLPECDHLRLGARICWCVQDCTGSMVIENVVGDMFDDFETASSPAEVSTARDGWLHVAKMVSLWIVP